MDRTTTHLPNHHDKDRCSTKRKLKQIQYRPHLVDRCLAGTDLIMDG
ncbi:hypothetical protein ACFVZH_40360 [Streptomyces sp. NPDC059534]